MEDVLQAHDGAFGVTPWGGDGAAGALFRQHGGAVRDRVTVFHHPAAPQGRQLPVKGGRAAGEVVREVVAAELRRVTGRFPKCFRGQQENRTPFIKIGARYHRRGMGACEGVLRKSRSVHGGSGRFVARGRAADGEKLFSAEGGTWEQMGGNPVIASDTGFCGAEVGGPEWRRRVGAGRLQLRSGWIYVNLRNKTFQAERGVGRWGRRSGGAVRFFMGRHGRVREEGA